MGIWKGFECINLCADTYTKSRMHVDVPLMWHYGMPYEMYLAFRDNHVNERLAYQHIASALRISRDNVVSLNPSPQKTKAHLLAFLGIEEV